MEHLILAIAYAMLLAAVLGMVRNLWVYRTRIRWLDIGLSLPHELRPAFLERYQTRTVSYGRMLLRWWCWRRDMHTWRRT